MRVFVNFLDILGILLLGVAVSVMTGSVQQLTVLSGVPDVLFAEPLLILSASGVVFLLKTGLGIALARKAALKLASIEVEYGDKIARTVLGGGLERLTAYSRPELEWAVLRSTNIAFPVLLAQGMTFLAELSLAVFLFGVMLATNWQATIAISLYFSVILAIFHWLSSSKIGESGSEIAQGSVQVNQAMTDIVSSFREIWMLQKLNFFLDRLRSAKGRVAFSEAKVIYLQAVPRLIVESALVIGALSLLGIQTLTIGQSADLAGLAVLIMASLRIMSALLPIQRSFSEIRFNAPKAESAQEILHQVKDSPLWDEAQSREESQQAVSANSAFGLSISLQNVSFSFTNTEDVGVLTFPEVPRVLENLTFSIESGEYVAIVGPSGAGKSTMIDLILGLYDPSCGKLLVEGQSPREFFSGHPGAVGYVPQSPGLISGTVLENVALGVSPEEVSEDQALRALADAELLEYVHSLREGVHSDLGPQTDRLSGGQRQRLGLARALYTMPRMVVLDEATSALDAETESSITETLFKLRGNVTVLVVAHRLSTIQNVDKVLVIENGKLVGSGDFRTIRKQIPLIREYVDLMSFDDEQPNP